MYVGLIGFRGLGLRYGPPEQKVPVVGCLAREALTTCQQRDSSGLKELL